MQLYISAITQKVHTSQRCSVTRRNHALNLETSATASELAAKGYVGCKRCGADGELRGATEVQAEPFTIDGQPACGAEVEGGRCGRAPGHGPEHPHIVDRSTIPAISEDELRTAVDGHYRIRTRQGRAGKLTGTWARRPGSPLADPYVRLDSGAFYSVHADAIVEANPDTEDMPDGPKRNGAGTSRTLAQAAREAVDQVGAELQAAADSGALGRVLEIAEPEPQPEPERDRSAVPCPSWCGVDHSREASGTSHQLRRGFGKDGSEGCWVTLYMIDYGTASPALANLNGQIDIHVHHCATGQSVIRPLAEAEDFAQQAAAFGRADIASLIREFAAVAAGKPRTNPYTPPRSTIEEQASTASTNAREAQWLAAALKITHDPQASVAYVSRYTRLVAFLKPSGELLKVYLPGGTLAGLLYQGEGETFRPVTRDHSTAPEYVPMALAVAQILTAATR